MPAPLEGGRADALTHFSSQVSPVSRGPLGGSRSASSRPPPTYPAGRVCSEVCCATRLSQYNREPTCFLHTEPMPAARR
jgi:hypothetical protein